jgi:diguanylate cyclase (GGDEF)-like protein
MVDGLTGLQNRAWLNDRLSAMVEEAHGAERPLSLIMIDLDHFKAFNDTHGHPGGDNALRAAAAVLAGALRPSDFAVRYGGEELIVILPDSSERAGMMVAQRLCERMRCAAVFADMRIPLPHITASFGVATLKPDQDADALLLQADTALYRAKKAGRNQIAC